MYTQSRWKGYTLLQPRRQGVSAAAVLTFSLGQKKNQTQTPRNTAFYHFAHTHIFLQEEHSLNIYNKLWIKIATSPADSHVTNS